MTVQGRHKERKVHKDRKARKSQPNCRSRLNCQRQRNISPWTQTRTMRYHETNLERLLTLSLQHLCYLYNQVPEEEISRVDRSDQHPVHTVHRPVLLQQVHKEHRPAPVLRMNPLTTMTSTEKENLAQQYRVMTQEGQCSTQTFMLRPITSTGQ